MCLAMQNQNQALLFLFSKNANDTGFDNPFTIQSIEQSKGDAFNWFRRQFIHFVLF